MFQSIVNYFSRHNSVRKVAENPATAAELLLLIHLGFADGEHTASETAAFSKIAEEQFGIDRVPSEEVEQLHKAAVQKR